jgi:hypothetical protein
VVDEGSTAHVSHAVQRILFGGFYYSGQSCISVQVGFAFYFYCLSPMAINIDY